MPELLQLTIVALALFAIYAIASLGFLLIYVPAKFFNFTAGIPVVLAPYLTISLAQATGSVVVGIVLAIVLVALLGTVLYLSTIRGLMRVGYPQTILLVATLGLYTACVGVIALSFGQQSIGVGVPALSSIELGGGVFATATQVSAIIVAVAVIAAFAVLWRGTLVGLKLRAIADDAALAEIQGIPVARIAAWSFAAGFALLGAAGLFVALDSAVRPTFAFPIIVVAMVAAAIGKGAARLSAAVTAAAVVAVAETAFGWIAGEAWARAISFVALLLVIIVGGNLRQSEARRA